MGAQRKRFLYLEVANDPANDVRGHKISSVAPNDVSHYVDESCEGIYKEIKRRSIERSKYMTSGEVQRQVGPLGCISSPVRGAVKP